MIERREKETAGRAARSREGSREEQGGAGTRECWERERTGRETAGRVRERQQGERAGRSKEEQGEDREQGEGLCACVCVGFSEWVPRISWKAH